MIRHIYSLHFDISLSDLAFHSKSQRCEKQRSFNANYLTKFLVDFYGFSYSAEACWSDKLYFILFWSVSSQGGEPQLGDIRKNFNVGLVSDIYRPI